MVELMRRASPGWTVCLAGLLAVGCRDGTGPDARFPSLEFRAPIQAMFPGMEDTLWVYRYGDPLPVEGPRWSSSDPAVLEVGERGVVRARGPGEAWARVELSDTADSVRIAVVEPPEGQIAFAGQRDFFNDSTRGLWLMNANGTGLRQLTNKAVDRIDDGNPSLSPNGCRIAFHASTESGGHALYRVDARTGQIVRLVDGAVGPPDWAPDGERIAFSGWVGGFEILTVRADPVQGGTYDPDLRRHTRLRDLFVHNLDYTSDPRYLVFSRTIRDSSGFDSSLRRIDLETGETALILTQEDALVEEGSLQDVAVSPDGRWLAYEADIRQVSHVFVLGPDAAPRRLVPPSRALISKQWPEGIPVGSQSPTFSPDGEWLAFTWTRDRRFVEETITDGRFEINFNTQKEIYVIRGNGSHPVRVTHFAWTASPDWGHRCPDL